MTTATQSPRCPRCHRQNILPSADATAGRCLGCGFDGQRDLFFSTPYPGYEVHSGGPFTSPDGFQIVDASGRVIGLVNTQIAEHAANCKLFLVSPGMLDAAARLIEFMEHGCEPWEIFQHASWKELKTHVQKAR